MFIYIYLPSVLPTGNRREFEFSKVNKTTWNCPVNAVDVIPGVSTVRCSDICWRRTNCLMFSLDQGRCILSNQIPSTAAIFNNYDNWYARHWIICSMHDVKIISTLTPLDTFDTSEYIVDSRNPSPSFSKLWRSLLSRKNKWTCCWCAAAADDNDEIEDDEYRCNRLRCPLARLSGLQCFNMGHNGHE